MVQCLVGLGSNLGDSRSILERAVAFLQTKTQVIAVSKWYSYPSVGPSADQRPQPDFLNGVVLLDSPVSASETADLLHQLEREAGRDRAVRWSSRTLDADLLIFGDSTIQTEDLIVPHPRMMSRRFVLEPAAEVAGNMVHPEVGWTIQQLFDHLRNAPPFFTVLGSQHQATVKLVDQLANATGGERFVLEKQHTTGLRKTETIDLMTEMMVTVGNAIQSGEPGPWFANFWRDRPSTQTLGISGLPKLILMLDAPDSELAKQVACSMEQTPLCRVPVIHLSGNERDAWQDALGAVEGMQ